MLLAAVLPGTACSKESATSFIDLGNLSTYKITPLLENPSLTEVAEAGCLFGFLDSPQPTLSDALQGITERLQPFTATT